MTILIILYVLTPVLYVYIFYWILNILIRIKMDIMQLSKILSADDQIIFYSDLKSLTSCATIIVIWS